MKNFFSLLFVIFLVILSTVFCQTGKYRSGIFLHHSTGSNIWGPNGSSTSVPQEINTYNLAHNYQGTDACSLSEASWPTNPWNNEWQRWHDIFENKDPNADIRPYLQNNKIIIIKSCFPSSQVTGWGMAADTFNPAVKSIYNYKWHWRGFIRAMRSHPDNFFVIWTNAPLVASSTNDNEARFSHYFCKWAKDTLAKGLDPTFGDFPPNCYIFDFFHILTNSSFKLDPLYAASADDSHPNAAATELVAPLLVDEVFGSAIEYEMPDISIETLSLVGSAFCPGSSLQVRFNTIGGIFNANNVFKAQLSDEYGGFNNPKEIGNLPGTSPDIITATLPKLTSPGIGYRIRVVSSSPAINGSDNGKDIIIYPLPTVSIQGKSSVCANNIEVYSTEGTGLQNNWTVTNGTIQGSTNGNIITVLWGSSKLGGVQLIQKNKSTNCADTNFMAITINPLPTPVIQGNKTALKDSLESYSTLGSSGVLKQWSVSGGVISGESNGNSVNVKWSQTGKGKLKLIQTITATGCKDSIEIEVNVIATLNFGITGPISVCEHNQYSYGILSGDNNDYYWLVTGGTLTGNTTGKNVIIIWGNAGGGIIKVIAEIPGTGVKDSIDFDVIINPLPKPVITGPATASPTSTVTYSANEDLSCADEWTVTGGTIITSATGDSVNVIWGSLESGIIKLIQTDRFTGCKDSTTMIVSISTGVNELKFINEVYIYPNPADEIVNINLKNDAGIREICLFNLLGIEIMKIELPVSQSDMKINTEGLPSGAYIIKLYYSGSIYYRRIDIRH
ncbi:MAG: hypothetical protein QG635_667 [Bacteroidota bacterium]|nr:hypothetical protein [Bacteroidota bacterium]